MIMDYIDVFSGIGGISLALKGYVNTVLYCEQNAYCQAVLTERMKQGTLDKAPIHPDIKTLYMPNGSKPRMIGGGFPCQDISGIGLQKGIEEGERSSLFFEIMRIVDECKSIDFVFLENVANISKCGMKEVVTELKKRGFNFQWLTRSASSMGAPHVRSRWFCLAIREGCVFPDLDLEELDADTPDFDWSKEPCPRSTFERYVSKHFLQFIQGITLFQERTGALKSSSEIIGRPAYHRQSSCGPSISKESQIFMKNNLQCTSDMNPSEIEHRRRNVWTCLVERHIHRDMYKYIIGNPDIGHEYFQEHVLRGVV